MELIGKVKVANDKFIEYGYTEGVLDDPITFNDAWERAFVINDQTHEFFGEELASGEAAATLDSDNFVVFLAHDFLEFHGIATGDEEEDIALLKKNAETLADLFEKWYEGMVFDLVLKDASGEELERLSPVSENVTDDNVVDIWKQYGGTSF